MTHTPPPLNPALIQPLSDGQLKQLMTDLNEARVAVKQGMSYLEAWDVKATLIRVFGFGGFSSELINSEILKAVEIPQASNANKMNWAITAKATVRLTIPQLGAVYTEAAIAGSKQPDFTESADMALKSAESDALKRAAIFLGTQFGLSLYNNGATQEVIKVVLAPGQEWLRGARVIRGGADKEAPQERPATAGGSVAHLRGEGVTPEQHQDNLNLLDQALSAKKKQQEHRGGHDVPVALDPTIDTAPDKRGLIDNVDGAVIDDELRAKAAAETR